MYRLMTCLSLGLLLMVQSIAQTAGPAKPATSNSDYYNDGIRLKDKKEFAQAVAAFKKAIAAKPTHKEALYEAGWCSNELGKYDDAIAFLLKAKQQWPNEAKIYFEIGYAYFKTNNLEEAKTNYYRCIALKKDYGLAYKSLGNVFYSQSEYAKALENYNSYTIYETDIDSDDFYFKKGYCENESGKYNEAIVSLNRSVELNNNNASTFDELGFAYYKIENPDGAIKNYNKSIELKPNSNVPYLGLGDVYKDIRKNTDEALKYYLKAVEYKTESKKTQYCIGWCYNDKSRYNDAIPYLKKAISIDKQYINALTELGYSYYALTRYMEALDEFNKAILIKKTALSLYYSGLCYIGMKNKNDALKMYDELKTMGSPNADKLKTKIDGM